MAGIFISYRRQDSQSAAGRLADHLREQLHAVSIFRDVETIEPGVDFVLAIEKALASCGAMLVVIGPRWLSATDATGRRRLDDPHDYTRLEVATALRREQVRVIPVLVEGAVMPAAQDLPEDLQPLCRRNAIELTDKRWEYDVSQLVETLRKTLGIEPPPPARAPTPASAPAAAPARMGAPAATWGKWAVAAALLMAVGVIGYLAQDEQPEDLSLPPTGSIPQAAQPAPQDAAQAPEYVPEGQADRVQDAAGQPPAAARGLTGAWMDAEGGRYEMVQQGMQVAFQGMSPHGPVVGVGQVQGNQLSLNYSLNDYPYQALLHLSANGSQLQGQYRDPLTGEVGPVSLVRTP